MTLHNIVSFLYLSLKIIAVNNFPDLFRRYLCKQILSQEHSCRNVKQ